MVFTPDDAIRETREELDSKNYEELKEYINLNGGYNLGYINDDKKTEELCLLAVQDDADAIKYVPEHLMTEKICYTAVYNDPRVMYYIPKKFLTQKVRDAEYDVEYNAECDYFQIIKRVLNLEKK